MAFSSKQCDGLFTKLYISYVDQAGNAHKAFVLPQKNSAFYDSCSQTYSVPEFIKEPVTVSYRALARAVQSSRKIEVESPITGATKKTSDALEQVRE